MEEVLSAADRLQTNAVVAKCELFLKRFCLNVDNCLMCMELAEKYDLEDLCSEADRILLERFVEVSRTPRFLDFDVNALCQYLSNDALAGDEDMIFRAALRWIKHNPSRKTDAARVLGNIRFPKMSENMLKTALEMKIIQENRTCKGLVNAALRYHTEELYLQPFKTGPQFESRGERCFVVIPEANQRAQSFGVNNRTTQIWNIPDEQGYRRFSTKIDVPFMKQSLLLSESGNFVFLFGTHGKKFTKIGRRLNAETGSVIELAPCPLKLAKIGEAAVTVDDKIYVFGGESVPDVKGHNDDGCRIELANITDSIAVYDIRKNAWHVTKLKGKHLGKLPQPLVHGAACMHKGVVYLTGGITNVPDLACTSDKCFEFNAKRNEFTEKATMLHPRAHHTVTGLGNCLYAVGGNSFYRSTGTHGVAKYMDYLSTIEVYEIGTGQWSFVARERWAVGRPWSVASGGEIVIVGGKTYRFLDEKHSVDVRRLKPMPENGYDKEAANGTYLTRNYESKWYNVPMKSASSKGIGLLVVRRKP